MSKKLLIARKKLQKRLPALSGAKAIKARKAIKAIDRKLAQEELLRKEAGTIGGLDFDVASPPGIGRLLVLPFYPSQAITADIVTASGAGVSNSQNPCCIALIGNTTNNCVPTFTMETPQISWATLRIVGFEVEFKTLCSQQNSAPTLLVNDLKVGGSTNLFTHESFGDASLYASEIDDYAGLRNYPLLISPNTVTVSVSAVSPQATLDRITFSLALVCDVVSDENYGRHLVGPYARGASMVRYKGDIRQEPAPSEHSHVHRHPHGRH